MEKLLSINEKQVEELSNLVDQVRGRFNKADETQERVLYELERAIWKLQLTPFIILEKKIEAIINELGAKLRKQVQCECSGFQFEAPEELKENLSNIILHLIRNSVSHGFESSFDRLSRGKLSVSKIKITASFDGAFLKIIVADDGRGLDLDLIVQKAVEKNKLTQAQAKQLSFKEKVNLILKTSVSTSNTMNEISGSGVGISAVKALVESLNGEIELIQIPNEGLRVEMFFPLKMIGLDATPVNIGDEVIWLPSQSFSVLETHEIKNKVALPLAEVLGWKAQSKEKKQTMGGSQFILLKENIGIPEVIAVDQIGATRFQFFRKLDPIWQTLGPPWLRYWLKKTNRLVLACRQDCSQEVKCSFKLGLLLDVSTVQKLVD
ncbi:MAG: hypothetical protein HY843_08170 [Bdellovibrio sp.]|nr:hypothetical protein [Bdellovibrio sp.]